MTGSGILVPTPASDDWMMNNSQNIRNLYNTTNKQWRRDVPLFNKL
jgi:hypothetical protein